MHVALLVAEGNKNKWDIGYFLVVEIHVALSLSDEHVTEWRPTLGLVRTAQRTPPVFKFRLMGVNRPATPTIQSQTTTCQYENCSVLIGELSAMRCDIVMI